MLEEFQGAIAERLVERLLVAPLPMMELSKSQAIVAHRLLLRGAAFSLGHGTDAHPLLLHPTHRLRALLGEIETVRAALLERAAFPTPPSTVPADVSAYLRRRACSLLHEPRRLRVLLAGARSRQTFATIHGHVGGAYRRVENDIFVMRGWGYMHATAGAEEAFGGAVGIATAPGLLVPLCELLLLVANQVARDFPSALDEPTLTSLTAAVATLRVAGPESEPTHEALSIISELLVPTGPGTLSARWHHFQGALRTPSCQRLLAGAVDGTPVSVEEATDVYGVPQRTASGAVNALVGRGLWHRVDDRNPPRYVPAPVTAEVSPWMDMLTFHIRDAISESLERWEFAALFAQRTRRSIIKALWPPGTRLDVKQLITRTEVQGIPPHVQVMEKAGVLRVDGEGTTSLCSLAVPSDVAPALVRAVALEEGRGLDPSDSEPRSLIHSLESIWAQRLALALSLVPPEGDGWMADDHCRRVLEDRGSKAERSAIRGLLDDLVGSGMLELDDQRRPEPRHWRYRLTPTGSAVVSHLLRMAAGHEIPLSESARISEICHDIASHDRLGALVFAAVGGRPITTEQITANAAVGRSGLYEFRVLAYLAPGPVHAPNRYTLTTHHAVVGPLLDLVSAIARRRPSPEADSVMTAVELLRAGQARARAASQLVIALEGEVGEAFDTIVHGLRDSAGRVEILSQVHSTGSIARAPDGPASSHQRALRDAGLVEMADGVIRLTSLGDAVWSALVDIDTAAAHLRAATSRQEARVSRVVQALDNPIRQDILRVAGKGPVSVATVAAAFEIPPGTARYHLRRLRDTNLLVEVPSQLPDGHRAYAPRHGIAHTLARVLGIEVPGGFRIGPTVKSKPPLRRSFEFQ